MTTSFYRLLHRSFLTLPGFLRGGEDERLWKRVPGLKGREAIVRNDSGQRLRIRVDSLGDLNAAFGRREERNIPPILSALPQGGVVLDVGAHIGGFSVIAAQAVGPTGHVFAFEPIPANCELLAENGKLNRLEWLIPVPKAVGRESGSIELLVSDTDTMWASSRTSWADVLHHGRTTEHTSRLSVPLITIDGFLRERGIGRVDLMKVDVEAAEMDVLAGAAQSLAAGVIGQIIVEVHGPTVKWADVAAILQRYGYEISDLGGAEMHAVLNTRARHESGAPKPATVALVGCGAVSEVLYAKALDELAGQGVAEVVALVDPNPAQLAKIGATFTAARRYRALEQMLSEVTPDCAIIAAPHHLHADLAVACLERGINVLCEKPMAVTSAECDRMLAAATTGSLLAVGHFRRFFPATQVIKEILQARLFGAVQSFRFLEGETYSWPAHSASFFTPAAAGGGVLIDAGAHTVDLLLWWLGDVATVEYRDDAMGGVEANCQLRVKMTSGASGFVQLSRDWPLPNRYVIECDNGWIAYDCDTVDRVEWGLSGSDNGVSSEIRRMIAPDKTKLRGLQSAHTTLMACFTDQLRNFVAALAGRALLRVPGVEARKSVALIERCYRQRQLLDMPWLETAEFARAQVLADPRSIVTANVALSTAKAVQDRPR